MTASRSFAKDLPSDPDCGVGVGPSYVERQMRDEFDEFLAGHRVLKRKFQMKRLFVCGTAPRAQPR